MSEEAQLSANVPPESKRLERAKSLLNDLSLFLAFLATAFAGWSGYEAHEGRLWAHTDTTDALRLANRSYVTVATPEIAAIARARVDTKNLDSIIGTPQPLVAKVTVKVFGPAPVFGVSILSDCQVGMIGTLTNKRGGIQESDIKAASPMLAAGGPPAIMVPGQEYVIPATCRYPYPGAAIGVIGYGAIHYQDVFGDEHYTHYCFQNPYLIPSALVDPDPKKWKRSAIDAGKTQEELVAGKLTPCRNSMMLIHRSSNNRNRRMSGPFSMLDLAGGPGLRPANT